MRVIRVKLKSGDTIIIRALYEVGQAHPDQTDVVEVVHDLLALPPADPARPALSPDEPFRILPQYSQ